MRYLLLALLIGPSALAAPFELYLYGEKPGLAEPFALPEGKAVRLHLPRGGTTTFAIRLPAEKPALLPLAELSLRGAKFAGAPSTVAAYALGVQSIEKSSFQAGPPPRAEVPDLAVPNDWLSIPAFHIPEKRVPAQPQYLFEIHAPEGALPGDFDAQLHFRRAGKEFNLPLQIRVHRLKLPAHFRLHTSFGFAPYGALIKHFGHWEDRELELHEVYTRLAAEHRIDLHKFYVKAPKSSELKGAQADPLAAGDKVSFLKLWQNAHASYSDLPVPAEEKNQPTEAYWRALQSSVIQHDLLDKTFVYFSDEPEAKEFPKLRENLKKIRAWAPQLSFLATTTYRADLAGTFNLWCPNLIQWDRPGFAKPADYLARRSQQNEHFWVYSSCAAHGCSQPQDTNTADLVTDRPAAYHRAFPWAAFDAQAEGILYYNTVEGYGASDMAPWRDPFLFHGYGEGNLFYPCTPRFCGVQGIRVVPSLRLKTIRDGLEDVEILEAGEKAGLPVREWAKAAYRGARDFAKSTAEYEKVRVRVLEALDGPAATPSPTDKK